MKSQIVEKLQAEINSGINTESQVVYLLAGIRKIIEQEDSSDQYAHLEFHCNWALHSRLKGSFAQYILKIFNSAHLQFLKGEEIATNSEVDQISKMEYFQNDISRFLSAHSITDFSKYSDEWPKFLYLYSRVIEDSPLIIRDGSSIHLKEVVVTVELSKEVVADHRFFKVLWNVKDKNGKAGTIFVINSFGIKV